MKIKIDGMMCQHCVKSVEKAALSVDGVTLCKADLESGTATIEGEFSANDVVKAIVDQGFTAEIM